MKAIIFTLACVFSLAAAKHSQANQFITTSTVIGGGVTFTPSRNVTLSVASDGVNYSAKSKHTYGNRRFGTNNKDPKIHYIASPEGATVTSTSTPTFDFSAWSTL